MKSLTDKVIISFFEHKLKILEARRDFVCKTLEYKIKVLKAKQYFLKRRSSAIGSALD